MTNRKKYYGAQTVSNFLPDEVKKILKKRGFFELELLKNWETIIGKKYGSLTNPVKIKPLAKGNLKDSAVLVLKVDPSIGFAIQHEMEKIINKLNGFFGYQAISSIEIIQEKINDNQIKKYNNNKYLERRGNSKNKVFEELIEYPELKKKFEKILSKISKN